MHIVHHGLCPLQGLIPWLLLDDNIVKCYTQEQLENYCINNNFRPYIALYSPEMLSGAHSLWPCNSSQFQHAAATVCWQDASTWTSLLQEGWYKNMIWIAGGGSVTKPLSVPLTKAPAAATSSMGSSCQEEVGIKILTKLPLSASGHAALIPEDKPQSTESKSVSDKRNTTNRLQPSLMPLKRGESIVFGSNEAKQLLEPFVQYLSRLCLPDTAMAQANWSMHRKI